jgi:hypothetical protein
MPFVAQKGNPWPLRCDDVAEMRAVLEANGVQFLGDTFDTGVCHMAIRRQRAHAAPPVRAVRVGPPSGGRCRSLAR